MSDTNEEKGRRKGVKMSGIVMGIVTGIASVALLAVCTQHRAGILDWMLISDEGQESGRGKEEQNIDDAGRDKQRIDNQKAGNHEIPDWKADMLHSDFFRQLAEIIWEKDWKDISMEEYASLTSLQIDRANGIVRYQLNYGQVGVFACPEEKPGGSPGDSSEDMGDTENLRDTEPLGDMETMENTEIMRKGKPLETDFSDLRIFTGLTWISVDGRLKAEDLQGLENLFGIYSKNSVEEIADMVSDPAKITELGIEEQATQKDLKDIGAFPNLKYLSLHCKTIEDISALKTPSGLQGLILEDCHNLHDYGPLQAMRNLEWLKISYGSLESVDFLKGMPKLSVLSLENMTIAHSAEELFGIPTLRHLYLNGCQIKLDFDGMPVNSGLEILSLSGCALLADSADGDEVSLSEHSDIFACFPNLSELYLASLGLENIEFVKMLPRLQYLDITGNLVADLAPLEQLQDFRGVRCGEAESGGEFFLF